MLYENTTVKNGRLQFAGRDTVKLAEKYGTPLYLMDEAKLRANCRTYVNAMAEHFEKAIPLYASKALSCKRIYEIVAEEGMGADVVSAGELYIAKKANFPMEKIFFHGNSKPESEIEYAVECGIGYFVIDNPEELDAVNDIAGRHSVKQKAILRLTPGIDPHTFAAVSTGKVDSKFGVAIATGQAEEFLKAALSKENIEVCGYHAHVGSQVFESTVFYDEADIMIEFAARMRDKLGYTAGIVNLGGGYGVRYTESDPHVDIADELGKVSEHIKSACKKYDVPMPCVIVEPGRSIVANAGMTLYTVQAVKNIPEYKNYVLIDGGMTDNPRYALYRSSYTVMLANKADKAGELEYTIGGRCCESGDMIQENVKLPTPEKGDTLAVFTTGAYNYSMSSNYNAVPRPPIVMVDGENDYVAVRRETFEDLAARDM